MARWRRSRSWRPAVWLALLAVLTEALLPAVHHPAGMALAGWAGVDIAHNLCLAPAAPADRDKAPAHRLPACPICTMVHAIGGFVPPAPSLVVTRVYRPVIVAESSLSIPQRRLDACNRARAPPLPA